MVNSSYALLLCTFHSGFFGEVGERVKKKMGSRESLTFITILTIL